MAEPGRAAFQLHQAQASSKCKEAGQVSDRLMNTFRPEVATALQDIIRELNSSRQVEKLWMYSMKAWAQTLKSGHFDLG
jgi:hypothetical protein